MTEQLEDLLSRLQVAIRDSARFIFAARAREFQAEAIDRLEALRIEASSLKAAMVESQNEDGANNLFCAEKLSQALALELRMWLDFKDDDPNGAWVALVGAQSAAHTAIQAHDMAAEFDMEGYHRRLELLEHLLFPPQLFFSAGVIIKRSTCSICGSEYGECDHLQGKVYMGQMCARYIEECKLPEVSIVPEPANKLCRAMSLSDGDIMRDQMTWRPIVPKPSENDDPRPTPQ